MAPSFLTSQMDIFSFPVSLPCASEWKVDGLCMWRKSSLPKEVSKVMPSKSFVSTIPMGFNSKTSDSNPSLYKQDLKKSEPNCKINPFFLFLLLVSDFDLLLVRKLSPEENMLLPFKFLMRENQNK